MYDIDLDKPILVVPVAIPFAYFGTDEFSVAVLDELFREGILPTLIITPPDRPKGRDKVLTPPPTKVWALEKKIPFLQPEKLDQTLIGELRNNPYDLFVVASYGKILPQSILDIPVHGTLNVHPSLLPKYRGPSPIESQIINDEKEVGVSIMVLDEKMDHGPLLIQEAIHERALPMPAPVLLRILADIGGRLLAKVMSPYLQGEIDPEPQNDGYATFCTMIKKEDGEIDLAGDQRKNYCKYLAFTGWPGTFFFMERKGQKIRVLIKDAFYENDKFKIKRVLPEGGREMSYEDFLRGTSS